MQVTGRILNLKVEERVESHGHTVTHAVTDSNRCVTQPHCYLSLNPCLDRKKKDGFYSNGIHQIRSSRERILSEEPISDNDDIISSRFLD